MKNFKVGLTWAIKALKTLLEELAFKAYLCPEITYV
jgi:hypothetical protein